MSKKQTTQDKKNEEHKKEAAPARGSTFDIIPALTARRMQDIFHSHFEQTIAKQNN